MGNSKIQPQNILTQNRVVKKIIKKKTHTHTHTMIRQPKLKLQERIKNWERERERERLFFSQENVRDDNKFIENKMRRNKV